MSRWACYGSAIGSRRTTRGLSIRRAGATGCCRALARAMFVWGRRIEQSIATSRGNGHLTRGGGRAACSVFSSCTSIPTDVASGWAQVSLPEQSMQRASANVEPSRWSVILPIRESLPWSSRLASCSPGTRWSSLFNENRVRLAEPERARSWSRCPRPDRSPGPEPRRDLPSAPAGCRHREPSSCSRDCSKRQHQCADSRRP